MIKKEIIYVNLQKISTTLVFSKGGVSELVPGSCFKDLVGNYIESTNVCKVKLNGKTQTFLNDFKA